ncbi:MAG: 23S rRNA (adenine(2503)-C(2))-methyltransferase RlmN [Candidatus Binatia bacterium]
MDLKGLTKSELEAWLVEHGEKPYRAGQICKWLYQRRATTFAEMTDIAAPLRVLLSQEFVIGRQPCARITRAVDGTCKFLFTLEDNRHIESVLIPAEDRLTLCVSSQVGCAMGCQFCATAQVRPLRDLTVVEILNQIWEVQQTLAPEQRITNLVFMGMGEALANYEAVVQALHIITADWGFNFSPRRVTVSTVGLVPQMRRLLEETQVNLTISLTATTNVLRDTLMPVNRRYPLEQLLAACRELPLAPRKRMTFAYTMLKGINDSEEEARRLTRLLHGLRAKVNLIPFNPFPGALFESSPRMQIERFRQILLDRGVHATIRESRGQDAQAACGQLAAEYLRSGSRHGGKREESPASF